MRLISVIIIILLTTSAFAVEPVLEMKEAVNSFYNAYLAVHASGVPSEKELQKFKPYVSASLIKLLKEADQAEQKYQKTTKGEVPPLVEGDLFTSLFEGATSYKVLSCDAKTSSCMLELSYVESKNGSSPFTWKDKVYLAKDYRGWLVDDIEFLGDWQFMHKGRLKDLLKDVAKQGGSN
jgi:hypothetical protein